MGDSKQVAEAHSSDTGFAGQGSQIWNEESQTSTGDDQLASKVRHTAAWRLANIDRATVPDLVRQLKTDTEPRRWAAAQILGEIHDESVMDDLVEALLDNSITVEWAASEALIKYDRSAILPLLEGITRHFDSERFRRGAFHVLYTLGQTHQLGPKIQEVLIILRSK